MTLSISDDELHKIWKAAYTACRAKSRLTFLLRRWEGKRVIDKIVESLDTALSNGTATDLALEKDRQALADAIIGATSPPWQMWGGLYKLSGVKRHISAFIQSEPKCNTAQVRKQVNKVGETALQAVEEEASGHRGHEAAVSMRRLHAALAGNVLVHELEGSLHCRISDADLLGRNWNPNDKQIEEHLTYVANEEEDAKILERLKFLLTIPSLNRDLMLKAYGPLVSVQMQYTRSVMRSRLLPRLLPQAFRRLHEAGVPIHYLDDMLGGKKEDFKRYMLSKTVAEHLEEKEWSPDKATIDSCCSWASALEMDELGKQLRVVENLCHVAPEDGCLDADKHVMLAAYRGLVPKALTKYHSCVREGLHASGRSATDIREDKGAKQERTGCISPGSTPELKSTRSKVNSKPSLSKTTSRPVANSAETQANAIMTTQENRAASPCLPLPKSSNRDQLTQDKRRNFTDRTKKECNWANISEALNNILPREAEFGFDEAWNQTTSLNDLYTVWEQEETYESGLINERQKPSQGEIEARYRTYGRHNFVKDDVLTALNHIKGQLELPQTRRKTKKELLLKEIKPFIPSILRREPGVENSVSNSLVTGRSIKNSNTAEDTVPVGGPRRSGRTKKGLV